MAQRIIQYISIPVEVLGVEGVLYKIIGREETPQLGIVHPTVHVDELHLKKVFMACVAPI